MKKNGFPPLLIVLIIAILGVVGYLVYNNILGGSFFWKTAKGNGGLFEITYPSNWHNCYENSGLRDILISDSESGCSIFPSFTGRFVHISDTDETSSKTDVKSYLDETKETFFKDEFKNIQPGVPVLPTAPGWTWNFEKYEKNTLCLKGASVAKVSGFGAPTYIVLYKHRVYELHYSSLAGMNSVPVRIILCSLRLP